MDYGLYNNNVIYVRYYESALVVAIDMVSCCFILRSVSRGLDWMGYE